MTASSSQVDLPARLNCVASTNFSSRSQVVYLAKLSHKTSYLQGEHIAMAYLHAKTRMRANQWEVKNRCPEIQKKENSLQSWLTFRMSSRLCERRTQAGLLVILLSAYL